MHVSAEGARPGGQGGIPGTHSYNFDALGYHAGLWGSTEVLSGCPLAKAGLALKP